MHWNSSSGWNVFSDITFADQSFGTLGTIKETYQWKLWNLSNNFISAKVDFKMSHMISENKHKLCDRQRSTSLLHFSNHIKFYKSFSDMKRMKPAYVMIMIIIWLQVLLAFILKNERTLNIFFLSVLFALPVRNFLNLAKSSFFSISSLVAYTSGVSVWMFVWHHSI